MRKKLFLAMPTAFLLAVCLGLSACISPQSTGANPPQESAITKGNYKFCTSFPSLANPFYAALNSAIKTAVTEAGDSLIPLDPGGYHSSQVNQIEDMLTEGIDAVFFAAVDPAAIEPTLKSLQNANVASINLGPAAGALPFATFSVLPNYEQAAGLCAQDALARLPGGGNFAILQNAEDAVENAAALILQAQLLNGNWLEVANFHSAQNLEQSEFDAFLQENTKTLKAIFATSDAAAIAAVQSLQNAGIKEGSIMVYSIGAGAEAKNLIAGAWLTASAGQSPENVAKTAVYTAYAFMAGDKPEKEQKCAQVLFTAENI